MDSYEVLIPEEYCMVMKGERDRLPCVTVLNTALMDFEPKEVFDWHLSLTIDFEELLDKGMPSRNELAIVDPFCDRLDEDLKADGNALFLIRETWNGTRRMVWRVYNPEIAHKYLQSIIEQKQYPREFDYYMEQDKNWQQATWYFEQLKA